MRPDEGASFSRSPRLRPSLLLGVTLETSGEPGAPRVSKEWPLMSLASKAEFGNVLYRRRDQLYRSW